MSLFLGHIARRRGKSTPAVAQEPVPADKKQVSQQSTASASSGRIIEPKDDTKHDSAVVTSSFVSSPGHEPNLLGRLFWAESRPVVQTSLFFKLPAELRNQIYELVFLSQDYTSEGTLIPSSQSIRNLGLLFACRQIYVEAIALAYSVTFSTTNRWHAADLKDMYVQLARLSRGLDQGGDALAAEAVPLIRIRDLDFTAHLRQPHWTHWTTPYGEEMSEMEFMDSTVDYVKFVYTALAVWTDIETITIWKDESAVSFSNRLALVLTLPVSEARFQEDHSVLCPKLSHEECELEAGMWEVRSDDFRQRGDSIEAGFLIVRKNDDTRKVVIKCKRSS